MSTTLLRRFGAVALLLASCVAVPSQVDDRTSGAVLLPPEAPGQPLVPDEPDDANAGSGGTTAPGAATGEGNADPNASYVGGPGSQQFANGLTCTSKVVGTGAAADVVIRLERAGAFVGEYVVGAAGALTAIRDAAGTNQLGPPICADASNEVDRISQWTCWDIEGGAAGLEQPSGCGGGDCRWNVTQAGVENCVNQYTRRVTIDQASCTVEVDSYHPFQWNRSNQNYFASAGVAALTRVTVPQDDGSIQVHRSLLLPPTTAGGQPRDFAQFYLEQWNAFPQPQYPFAVYSYDAATGAPNWYYRSGPDGNMPSYALQSASANAGYVSVAAKAETGAQTVALAFSREDPCAYGNDGQCRALAGAVSWANLLDATGSGVVALLPGMRLDKTSMANAVVAHDVSYTFWPAAPADAHAFLAAKAAALPRPWLSPAGVVPAAFAADVARLQATAQAGSGGGRQVGHLGALVGAGAGSGAP